jgi:hypothetical protein
LTFRRAQRQQQRRPREPNSAAEQRFPRACGQQRHQVLALTTIVAISVNAWAPHAMS